MSIKPNTAPGPTSGRDNPSEIGLPGAPKVSWAIALCFFLPVPVLALLTMRSVYVFSPMRTYSLLLLGLELAIICLAIFQSERTREALKYIAPASLVLGGLWFASILLSWWSASFDPSAATLHLTMTTIHAGFAIALWSLFVAFPNARKTSVAALAAGLGTYTVLGFTFALAMSSQPDFDWRRFGAGVTNIRHAGYIAVALSGLSLALLLNADKALQRRFAMGLFFLGAFLVFWSGGRGAFLAFAGQIVLGVIIADTGQRKKIGLTLVGIAFVALCLAALYVPSHHYGPQSIFARTSVNPSAADDLSSRRLDIWRQTASYITQRPFFGYGESQFRLVVPAASQFLNHPHNFGLQLVFQWGTVGTGFFVALMAYIVRRQWPLIRARDPMARPAILVIAGLLALAMVDGPFYYVIPTFVALTTLAALAAETTLVQRGNRAKQADAAEALELRK